MEFVAIDETNRECVNEFIESQWHAAEMVIRGSVVDMTGTEGIVVWEKGNIVGLLTYLIRDGICEIVSLDSRQEGRGIGRTLIEKIKETARRKKCRRLVVITTNDNIQAIRFYQRCGFDMAHLYHNALSLSRKLKPEIPLIGANGIPLMHEIEFVMDLEPLRNR